MLFDARQFEPSQGFPSHPPGKFRAMIVNTSRAVVKDNPQNGMFVVDFQTDAGRISKRYNLWNMSPEAVRIANGELSALCWATGIFQLEMDQDGAQLRNAQLYVDVTKQAGDSKYMEVSHVFDINGNEPGKAPQGQLMAQPAQPQFQQPAPAAPQPQFQQPAQPQFQPPNPPPGAYPNPAAPPAQPSFQPPGNPGPFPGAGAAPFAAPQQQQPQFQPPAQPQQGNGASPPAGAPWNR